MSGATVDVVCPVCGTGLHVVLAPAPPTQWFPCPHCRTPMPVVVPRDPPPLYSWEVLPGLYPALPSPRIPKRRRTSAVTVALLVIAVLSAALAGALVYDAYLAVQPATYSVDGYVETFASGFAQPIPGATVVLTDDTNQSTRTLTGTGGSFSFSGVPAGGVTLNVSAPGYSPVSVETFASSIYATQISGLAIDLSPGSSSNVSTIVLTDFPDLEQLVASLGSGAILLGAVTVVAGAAAVITARVERPAIAVIGGGAGVVSPFIVAYLSLSPVSTFATVGTVAAAAIGAFVVAWRATQMAQSGPAAD